MESIVEVIGHLTDPDWIMQSGGLYLVLLILFIESGLFFGFFLPGDPLLFISGMIIAGADQLGHPFSGSLSNLIFWEVLFIVSAVAGNFVGYWFGSKFSHRFTKPQRQRWFFKQTHIQAANDFYKKNGGFAVTVARFLPVVRTFVPIVGGIVKMNRRHFAFFNTLGAIIWVVLLCSLGYLLGGNEWINQNLEWTLLGIVVVVTLPVVIRVFIPSKPAKEVRTIKN